MIIFAVRVLASQPEVCMPKPHIKLSTQARNAKFIIRRTSLSFMVSLGRARMRWSFRPNKKCDCSWSDSFEICTKVPMPRCEPEYLGGSHCPVGVYSRTHPKPRRSFDFNDGELVHQLAPYRHATTFVGVGTFL